MDNRQMINLFYSRSDTDHLEYIFTQAAQWTGAGGKALVIVPDQYTLETERKAFAVLQTKGLMDLQIMSFSRMAAKLAGGSGLEMKYIDDLGRTMLLRKVLSENREKLTVFAPAAGRSEFVRMMGNMIQEFKQFETNPDAIEEAARNSAAGGLLGQKLADSALIYRAYEDELKGRYLDTEDQLSLLCREIEQTGPFDGWAIWVTGFDFYSRRLVSVLEALAARAASLNAVLHYVKPGDPAYSLFAPLETTVSHLKGIAARTGKAFHMEEIGETHRISREEDLTRCAEDLYRFPCREWKGVPEHIRLLACGDRETELEWTADEICRLVREEGLRFRDIAVAANDLEERRAMLQRIFRRSGIRYFDGRKTMAVTNKYMQFLLGLCDLESYGQRTDGFLRILSTGVTDVTREEAEKLENYLNRYGDEGWRWEQDFTRLDRSRIDPVEAEELLRLLNDVRRRLMAVREELDRSLEDCSCGRQYGQAFFAFLQDRIGLGEQIQADADRLKEAGDLEYSAVTVQLWNKITLLFGQLTEVLGDAPCSREDFFEILRTGVESLEVRMIPTTIDQVLVTDVKRAGPEGVKVLFLLGVNEGLIPRKNGDPGILSDREKEKLNGLAGEVCLSGRRRPEQEKLEIYRTLSLTREKLVVSYARQGNGEETGQPSLLIGRIRKIFPKLAVEEVEAIREGPLAEILLQARKEYLEQHPGEDRRLEMLEQGEKYGNVPETIGEDLFRGLYGDEIRMSPTSLEYYARCPFAHFLRYGLRAEEPRVFELSSPELGTVFHEILMRFSREMSERNRWSVADEDLCKKVVTEFAGKVAEDFNEGQLFEGPEGEYRLSRVRGICEKTAVMVARHINRGRYRRFYFEMAFGKDRSLPALELAADSDSPVWIEGRIDRIDIAEGPGGSLLKIIDYKSGGDKISQNEVRKGYRMQLMMYMLAAREGMEKRYRELGPAGVYYFYIREPSANLDKDKRKDISEAGDAIEKEWSKTFRMNGITVNEPEVIEALDEDFSKYSEVAQIQRLKNGEVKGTTDFNAPDREGFEELLREVKTTAEGFARGFTRGEVPISPMKGDGSDEACKYCPYHSVCGFDRDLPGFGFR